MIENLNKENEEQLIINIKNEVEKLNIDAIVLQTTREEIKVDKIGESDAVYGKIVNIESYKSKVDYLEFVRSLSISTKIPLLFSVKIFNALSNDFKENTLAKNPAQTLKEIKEIIRKHLVNLLKSKVRYDGIENSVLPNVFKTENGETYLDTGSVGKFQKDIEQDFSLKTKWVFENVIEYDSNFEIEIIEKDAEMDEIEIFGKLPKLKIKTPLGEYNPDFCYAIKGNNGNKIFLIVESKGYETSTAIPENEKGKMAFAEKYFQALNDFYRNENVKISFKERISSTQLASLINN
ncbi:restriction endonuclease [Chryseobacterium sp.]|uniref:restriction endonuclease n=1 Tax=Chryseobacterium sp. TaxID=1871047 RepID=UPI003FA5B830